MSLPFINSECVFLEIGQNSLKVLDGDAGLELALERREGGRLTDACRERLTAELRGFLNKNSWRGRRRAFCAIGARGISLRRLTLPSASEEELQRLLLLQIESQFPLPPEELAWGYTRITGTSPSRNGPAASQELIVAATKREIIEEYRGLLSACGLNPVFTLGALARSLICPQPSGSYAALDIGRTHAELVSVENGVPTAIRVLPWGGENVTRAIEAKLKVGHAEAEKLKLGLEQPSASQTELDHGIQDAVRAELETLAQSIKSVWRGRGLYVSGRTALLQEIIPTLTKALDGGGECQRMGIMPGIKSE